MEANKRLIICLECFLFGGRSKLEPGKELELALDDGLWLCPNGEFLCDHIFISSSCCSKLKQTGCLKTVDIYHLTILEVSSPKSGVSMAALPLKALGAVPSLLLSNGCQQSSASIRTWSFLCVCLCAPFPLLISSPITLDLGPTLVQYELILTNSISKDTISKKSHSLSSGGCEFLRYTLQPGIDSDRKTRERSDLFHLPELFWRPLFNIL